MDKGALGARNQIAHERIIAAVKRLTEGNGIDAALLERLGAVREKDKAVRAMKEREIIADILEAVADHGAEAQQVVMATLEATEAEFEQVSAEDAALTLDNLDTEAEQMEQAEMPPVIEKPRRGKGK